MFEFLTFVNLTAFLSYIIVSILVLAMSKKFLERISYRWYLLSFGITLAGLNNIFSLFSLPMFGAITNFFGSILLLVGFTLVLFELVHTYQLKGLEERKRDMELLLTSLKSEAKDDLAKEVINNLEKELIDIERKIKEIR